MMGVINIKKEDFEELKTILINTQCKNLDIQYNKFFNNIGFFSDCGVDLYLRSSVSQYLTIARINLPKKRQGTCTAIIQWLIKYAKENNFKGIEIESVCSKEMDNFCNKHNFAKVQNVGMELDEMWFGNYRLDI